MKIGINAQGLISGAPCGINTYLRNLIPALSKLDHANDFLLFSSDRIHLEGLEENVTQKSGRKWGSFSLIGFSRLFNENECDVAFIPKETLPLFIKKPVVITVYDLFFIKMYRKFKNQIKLSAKIHYELARLTAFKKATKLCAISTSCKEDLVEICDIDPQKIEVTPLSFDPQYFFPRSEEEIGTIRKKYSITQPYFLNISSIFWDPKNVMGVLKAFRLIQEAGFPHELIMVGKIGPSYSKMQEYIERYNLKVKCLISITVEEIAILLSGAQALVYPSFHEGFGLPIVEAMAAGCPVITSNVSAMPETAGGAALLVDPYQCEDLFEAMKKIIENKEVVNQLKAWGLSRAQKFSWSETAKKTLDVIYSV